MSIPPSTSSKSTYSSEQQILEKYHSILTEEEIEELDREYEKPQFYTEKQEKIRVEICKKLHGDLPEYEIWAPWKFYVMKKAVNVACRIFGYDKENKTYKCIVAYPFDIGTYEHFADPGKIFDEVPRYNYNQVGITTLCRWAPRFLDALMDGLGIIEKVEFVADEIDLPSEDSVDKTASEQT